MKQSKRTILFWIMLAIGLLCSLVLLSKRIVSEYNDRSVSFAVSYEDVLTLATADGRAPADWLNDLSSIGVAHLIVTDQNQTAAEAARGEVPMHLARSGDTARQGDSFLIPELHDGEVIAYSAPKGEPTVPLALVENRLRTDVIMPDDFDPELWQGPMVKTLYMYDAYSYHWEMQEPATENENILFRALTDRGMRLVILTPLVDESKTVVSDFDAYVDLMTGLAERTADRGIIIGDAFSAMNAPTTNRLLVAGALMLLAAIAYHFLTLLLPLGRKVEYVLLAAAAVVICAGAFVLPALMQKLGAFGAAVLFPCFAAFLLVRISQNKTALPLLARFVFALCAMLAIGLSGGLYVGALLASRPYMMLFKVFSGVKLSQLLPIAFAALVLLYVFFNKKARRERENTQKLPIPLLVLIGVCVLAALVVLVLRSGDNMLPVSDLEVKFRNWLEYVLYARPRTKEMFLAFPALALYVVASDRRIALLQLPLGILASIGACSVVNTFCHIFTPVHVSLLRTLLSAGIGFVVGALGMLLLSLLLGKKTGGNAG